MVHVPLVVYSYQVRKVCSFVYPDITYDVISLCTLLVSQNRYAKHSHLKELGTPARVACFSLSLYRWWKGQFLPPFLLFLFKALLMHPSSIPSHPACKTRLLAAIATPRRRGRWGEVTTSQQHNFFFTLLLPKKREGESPRASLKTFVDCLASSSSSFSSSTPTTAAISVGHIDPSTSLPPKPRKKKL